MSRIEAMSFQDKVSIYRVRVSKACKLLPPNNLDFTFKWGHSRRRTSNENVEWDVEWGHST